MLFYPLLSVFAVLGGYALPTNSSLAARATSLGYLKCISSGQTLGYVSKQQNSYGEYIGVSGDDDPNDKDHRMLVKLDTSATGSTNLLVTNGPDNDYPFFGGIGGEAGTMLGNNSNYMVVGGTGESQPGAAADYIGNTFTDSTNKLRKAESAIWQYDSSSGVITPVWVNDDKAAVKSYMGYVDSGFVLAGNKKDFENEWEDEVDWVTLHFTTD